MPAKMLSVRVRSRADFPGENRMLIPKPQDKCLPTPGMKEPLTKNMRHMMVWSNRELSSGTRLRDHLL